MEKYEMNPYLLTDEGREKIREGIMLGEIGEKEIREIGQPLRMRYNEIFVEGFNELADIDIQRNDLIRQEIYHNSYDELMEIKDKLQLLRKRETEVLISSTPIKNMEKTLREAREVGTSDNDPGQLFLNESDSSAFRVISVLNDARTRLPAEWIEKSNSEPIIAEHVSRGFFIKKDGISTIALSGGRGMERCAYHELGHHFEELYPEIRKLEHEFYNRRTAGEKARWLGPGYSLKEKTRFDEFRNPYMGKDYGNKEDSGYEILSMGLEGLYTGAYKLHNDTEYQDFIFGVLASI